MIDAMGFWENYNVGKGFGKTPGFIRGDEL